MRRRTLWVFAVVLLPIFLTAQQPATLRSGQQLKVARRVGRHRVSTLPTAPPVRWVDQWRLLEQKRRIEAGKRDIFASLSMVMGRPDFGSMGSETGQPFFSGADTAFGFSNLYPYSASLQRQSDCSLNEVVGGLAEDNSDTPELVQDIAHYEKYLHTIAGLTTTVDKFANGCTDPTPSGILGMGAYTSKDSAGDFTGGGFNFSDQTRLDIRVLNSSFSQVSVTHVSVFNGGEIDGVMSVDLNGDGYPDFVVVGTGTDYSTGMFAVLLNNHDGTFAAPVVTSLANTTIAGMVGGDFNGDGHADLLLTTSVNGAYSLLFYGGKGNGTFSSAVATSTGTTEKLVETPVDINKDGRTDVLGFDITYGGSGGATSPVLDAMINNGSASFTSKQSFSVKYAGAVAAGDLNGDGKLDLAVLDPFSQVLALAKGDGTGSFAVQNSFPTPYDPSAVVITDLDGDGYQDVAIAYSGGGFFAPGSGTSYGIFGLALLGNNDFTLSTPPILTSGKATAVVESANSVAVADFNGDGKQDVAALAGSDSALVVQTYLNSSGKLVFNSTLTTPFSTALFDGNSVVAVDLNGDGKQDLLVSGAAMGTGTTEIVSYINNGTASFTQKGPLVVPGLVYQIATGDVNGDGHQDVVFLVNDSNNPSANGLYVATGKNDGTFNTPVEIDGTITAGSALAAADLNGDGKLDLVAVQSPGGYAGSSTVYVYLNKGTGTFAAPLAFQDENADFVTSIAVADFNKDGAPDLALLGNLGGNAVLYTYAGNKTGKFTLLAASDAGDDGATNIAVVDINQDGLLDIVQDGCCGNASPSVLLASGPGQFYPEQPFATIQSAYGVHPIALNADAYPDIVFGSDVAGPTPVINNYGAAPSFSKAATTTAVQVYATEQGVDSYPTVTVAETKGGGVPTGAISYTFNGKTYTAELGSGTAYLTLPITDSMAGSYPITVTYPGDQYNAASTVTGSQSVIYATDTSFTTSTTSVTEGNTITLTAKVTRPYGTGTPTGDVGFWYNGGNSLLANAKLVNGVATLTASTAGVPTGIYNLFAEYGSDTDDGFSDSPTISLTVLPKGDTGTTTTLALNPDAAVAGQTVSATINVAINGSSTKATGSATLYLDNKSVAVVPLSNGKAVISVPVPDTLTFGGHTVYAKYNTNGKDFESSSVPQTFTLQYPTTTYVTLSSSTVSPGDKLTIGASVYSPAYGAPTGTITFYADGVAIGSAALVNDEATLTLTVPGGYPSETYEITARYSGDAYSGESTSTAYGVFLQ